MTPELPAEFLRTPVAHRALHGLSDACPENSRAAIRAAIEKGYAIEIDLQLTSDGQAVVFHDYDLGRLTAETGPVRGRTVAELAEIPLANGDGETIPSFAEVLSAVDGQVPLLVELKDQDGALGANIGLLERATAEALKGYEGPVAVMSFNPHSVAKMAELAPDLPRGLTTGSYDPTDWPVPPDTCDRLREIPDFDTSKAAFISHQASDLDRDRVQELKHAGVPILCWTIRSVQDDENARKVADNVTFEGYLAEISS
jgi:glycerophosphoryl diester phosphodiesterase